MRAVIQKVTRAEVGIVHGGGCETVGQISDGLLVLLGVGLDDGEDDARYIADKTAGLRIFEDEAGKLNLSLRETGGAVLLVSQFTLHGDARSGRRPAVSPPAPPPRAGGGGALTAQMLRDRGIRVETGRFRTHMQVSLCNDGPVTLLLDSKKLF